MTPTLQKQRNENDRDDHGASLFRPSFRDPPLLRSTIHRTIAKQGDGRCHAAEWQFIVKFYSETSKASKYLNK